MIFPVKMEGIRNKKLDREDYEFVVGANGSHDSDMVWFRIDGKHWRVLKRCNSSVYNGAGFQAVVSNYEVADAAGNERYIAIEEFYGFCRELGLAEEVTLIGELEDSLEESREAHRAWLAERTRKS